MGKLPEQPKRLLGRIELGKLRYPPWRRRVLSVLIVFPFILGAVLALTVGFVIALAGFGAAFTLPGFFRHDLIPGPRLSTAIATNEGHSQEVDFPSPELRVIDGDAIISASQKAARETAPEIQPEPESPFRLGSITANRLNRASANYESSPPRSRATAKNWRSGWSATRSCARKARNDCGSPSGSRTMARLPRRTSACGSIAQRASST